MNEMTQTNTTQINPLGTEPVGRLLRRFAVPSIVAMLVNALYNMVDQIFIGHSIGELGNASDQCGLSPDHQLYRSGPVVRYRSGLRL